MYHLFLISYQGPHQSSLRSKACICSSSSKDKWLVVIFCLSEDWKGALCYFSAPRNCTHFQFLSSTKSESHIDPTIVSWLDLSDSSSVWIWWRDNLQRSSQSLVEETNGWSLIWILITRCFNLNHSVKKSMLISGDNLQKDLNLRCSCREEKKMSCSSQVQTRFQHGSKIRWLLADAMPPEEWMVAMSGSAARRRINRRQP